MFKSKFFVLALGTMLLGACSNEEFVENGGSGNVGEGTEGYVSLRINLPHEVSSRAESFDDGLKSEYYVNDATLLLFAGNSEAEATFQSAYDLKTIGFADESTSSQITSKATITQQITKPKEEAGANLYAMVVLNDNGLISIGDNGSATFDGTALTGKNLSWLTTTISTKDAAALTSDGFFMTNAPLASTPGGAADPTGATVQTLATVDQSKIFTTAAEAGNAPAAVVFVERAVAKVTVTKSSNLSESNNPNVESYVIQNWCLDNTNTKTYLVRNVSDAATWLGYKNNESSDFRFVGGTVVGVDVNKASWYRTYFAKDPNYDKFVDGDLVTIGGKTFAEAGVKALQLGHENPGYCLENVFNLQNQKEPSTTRVIVAAQLKIQGQDAGADFYTFNDNTSVVYTLDGVIKEVKRIALDWLGRNKGEWLKPAVSEGEYEIGEEALAVTVPSDKGGYIENDITLDITLPAEATMVEGKTEPELEAAMKEEVAKKLTLGYYKGGVSYYPVLVQHFGDSQTPWEYSEDKVANSYPEPNAAENWLGRWGVLRNNWYQINVSGVKNIGLPEVPTVKDRFDDPTDSYMAVEINVLSWALRTQDVEL